MLLELKARFRRALAPLSDDPALLDLVRPSQDPKFGDYQANFAMPLGKRLNRPPREVAQEVVARLEIDDLCQPPEIAGPGFINLRLNDAALVNRLQAAFADPRLGVAAVPQPQTYVIDYSAPNVAKPMHVGHIRSTVIGDALYRTLAFLGHRVIGDNHIGDWGTQFGMILYGYKNFRDDAALQAAPVQELARLYRHVRRLMDYFDALDQGPQLDRQIAQQEQQIVAQQGTTEKKAAKELRRAEGALAELRGARADLAKKLAAAQADPAFMEQTRQHATIRQAVLQETARLHADDPENLRLWREFLPACMAEIHGVYQRLGVRFDHELGESFYHPLLATVVDELLTQDIAVETDGAIGVFTEGQAAPLLIRKQDGAFLYATTDLATIRYRMEHWKPDAILYVVDHRQSLHFVQLFATARRWGYAADRVRLEHVSFGTVLGDDGKPFKTRSGDTVGLEGLLDEAVARAGAIVAANDDAKPNGPELSPEQRGRIAETVGIGALKYADLAQNRTSDYVFSYDKMLAMNGNTATYMQYAYARVRSIFARGKIDHQQLCGGAIHLDTPAERALGLELLRFGEALELVVTDFRPNQLTNYLFELANRYSTFFEECPVLRAESEELRASRLRLCDLTARTIAKGLELLGIDVVEKM